MRTVISFVVVFLLAVSVHAQTVVFGNNSSYLINVVRWNPPSANGLMTTNANTIQFGLYVGFAGSFSNQLVLAGTTYNSPVVAGIFNGGNPFTLDSNQFGFAVAGNAVAFQIRAWSASAGSTYEQAYQSALSGANPNMILGTSQMGYVTLGGGIAFPGALFGVNPGQISAFTLIDYSLTPTPEPATWLLGLAGSVFLLGLRRFASQTTAKRLR